jgi:hypothetical protein
MTRLKIFGQLLLWKGDLDAFLLFCRIIGVIFVVHEQNGELAALTVHGEDAAKEGFLGF